MRKLWFKRRGVSSMIGGVIVLALFLTSFAAMILVNQQYDSYQVTVNAIKQADMDRFSENLRPVPPGLVKTSSATCPGGKCTTYTLMITDLVTNASATLGIRVARIYVNSTRSPGCTTLCVLNPSGNPAPYAFQASQSYINPGEFEHNVTLWFPSSITLPNTTSSGKPGYGLNTVSITTARGRQFSLQWPIPPSGAASGGSGTEGGTGLYIGPLVITFQKQLIAYSTSANQVSLPIGGKNGAWVIPPPPFILYIKIETDVGVLTDVYLTAQSVIELAKFDSPGEIYWWFIVAPISWSFCQNVFHVQDPTIICDTSYGYYAAGGGNNGDPGALKSYSACNSIPYSSCPNRYKIPKPTVPGQRGDPVIVAFSADGASSAKAQTGAGGYVGKFVTSYLGLTYVYNDGSGSGDYTYALTLPFMAMCIDKSPNECNI
jgi:hypothetical protein